MGKSSIEQQEKIETTKMEKGFNALFSLGLYPIKKSAIEIQFMFEGGLIKFYPESGWHTGSTIQDGKGLEVLLTKLKSDE